MIDKENQLIDIIIPNWNGEEMLEMCLNSLRNQTSQKFTVTVVDNGSSDGSLNLLKTQYPEVQVLPFQENRGFSAAVNEGIKKTNNTWILLLNNDIEMARDCVEILLENCLNQDEFDLFALKMLSFDQRSILDGAGDGVLRGGVGYRLGTMEIDCPHYQLRRNVFGACAGAALYRRTLFKAIGLFDEDFFAYLEDVDLNLRAVRSGHKCFFLPDAKVYHIGSGSTGSKINHFTICLSTRNNIFVLIKHYSPAMFIRFLPAILIYQLFWFMFVLKKGQLKAYFKGLMQSISLTANMIQKREDIKKSTSISARVLGDMMVISETAVIHSIMARRRQAGKNNWTLETYLRFFC